MTHEEIKELFIRAAETDHRLPKTEGPKPVKGQSLPYVHDFLDQLGWGGDRYAEERADFWSLRSSRLSAKDVTEHELCNELILLVDEALLKRHALWAWAKAKAGGKSFASWCRSRGISKTWASELKNRAIAQIATGLALKMSQNSQIDVSAALPVNHQIGDKLVKMRPSRPEYSWRDGTAYQPVAGEHDFSWADKRNQLRRQRRNRQMKQKQTSQADQRQRG